MKKLKILLAEDNQINQKIALLMLKKFDQTIDLANNGLDAVEKFRKSEYDIILMDLHMPELDGFEATVKIRQIESLEHRPKRVKIYAMTASSLHDERDNCIDAGMDGYLSKPFKNVEVEALLKD